MNIDRILSRYLYELHRIPWSETTIDGTPFMDALIGQIALDIYPTATPITWKVRVMAFEGYDGEPEIEGTAETVEEAKAAAGQAAKTIIPAVLEFLFLKPPRSGDGAL